MTAPARYWRIVLPAVSGRSTSLRTLRWFDANDVALSDGMAAGRISVSRPAGSISGGTTNLVDADTATMLQVSYDSSGGLTITFDFQTPVMPSYLVINVADVTFNVSAQLLAEYTYMIVDSSSDNVVWTRQQVLSNPIPAYDTNLRLDAWRRRLSSRYYIPPSEISGTGGIYGIVSEDGVALSNRPVYLYERNTFHQVASATTDENGGYSFTGLNTDSEFLVMSVDPSGPPYKNAIVWDRIKPINALGAGIPTVHPFWARRGRDPAFGGAVSVGEFAETSGVIYAGNVLGPTLRFAPDPGLRPSTYAALSMGQVDGRLIYGYRTYIPQYLTNFSFAPTFIGANGTIRFLRSSRTSGSAGRGLATVFGHGLFSGTNATNIVDNFGTFTFEHLFVAPQTSESALVYVWSGTSDADDRIFFGLFSEYSYASSPGGPTLEVTPTGVVNVRMPLNGRNRSTVRCSGTVVPGTINHVVVTYVINDTLALYINGALVQQVSIAGTGRVYGYMREVTVPTESWDTFRTTAANPIVPEVALRRINFLGIYGYGATSDAATSYSYMTAQPLGPGYGGAHGFAAFYGRAMSTSDVQNLYDSLVNPTHTVLPTQPGYMGEVEADVPELYFRLNETVNPSSRFNCLLGRKDLSTWISGELAYSRPPFVGGSPSIGFNNGSIVVLGTSIGSRFTIEFWCRFTSLAGRQIAVQWRNYDHVAPVTVAFNGNILRLEIGDLNDNYTPHDFTFVRALGTDYHVVLTYDPWGSGKARAYVNGVQIGELPGFVIPMLSGVNWMFIGSAGNGTAPTISDRFQGDISDLAVYNYELPASRILEHYNARNL